MKLYIVATPIGNLKDITLRALDILKSADCILCEDTRVTQKLLKEYGISARLVSYHQHSGPGRLEEIGKMLEAGGNLVLVSDAGTPGISDPGGRLVEYVVKNYPVAEIIPIPGANAAVAALSISGFPADNFLFLGFPPHKKGRNKFFLRVAESDLTVVFYESRYRMLKTLESLKDLKREMAVCRELTKMHETIYRGNAEEIASQIKQGDSRGEFVVVINRP